MFYILKNNTLAYWFKFCSYFLTSAFQDHLPFGLSEGRICLQKYPFKSSVRGSGGGRDREMFLMVGRKEMFPVWERDVKSCKQKAGSKASKKGLPNVQQRLDLRYQAFSSQTPLSEHGL